MSNRGSNHTNTIDFMHKLALLYIVTEQLEKAEYMLNECLELARLMLSQQDADDAVRKAAAEAAEAAEAEAAEAERRKSSGPLGKLFGSSGERKKNSAKTKDTPKKGQQDVSVAPAPDSTRSAATAAVGTELVGGGDQQIEKGKEKKKKLSLTEAVTAAITIVANTTKATIVNDGDYHENNELFLAVIIVDYAELLHKMKNLETALEYYEEGLRLSLRVRSGSHKETIRIMEQILLLCGDSEGALNRPLKSLELYQLYYDELLRTRGQLHQDTLQCMNNLGFLYAHTPQFPPAHGTSDAVVATSSKALIHHPEKPKQQQQKQQTESNASVESVDHFTKAEQLLTTCLDCRQETLGAAHPDTLTTMHNLANLHLLLGRYDASYRLFVECFQLRRRALGPHHEDTLDTKQFLWHICRNVYNREFDEFQSFLPQPAQGAGRSATRGRGKTKQESANGSHSWRR